MRIAHVLTSLNLGGQERVALDLAVGQKEQGHDVITIAMDNGEGPLALEYNEHGLEVIGVVKKNDGFDWGLPLKLSKVFREHRVQIIHTHNPTPLLYCATASKLVGAKLIHTKHGINPAGIRLRIVRGLSARFVDVFVCVSKQTEDVAIKNLEASPCKIQTIINGTNLSRFGYSELNRKKIRDELSIPKDAFVVGTVGRLYPEKNHGLLIDAVNEHLGPHCHLVIVGEGGARQSTEKKIGGLINKKYIHLLGLRRDIPALLSAFDVFALSSKNEGLPIVLLEAMATGLPIVSTRVGGIPDLIEHGRLGYLVETGAVKDFSDAIYKIKNNPDEAKSMGKAAQKFVLAHYSSNRMVEDYMSVYAGEVGHRNG